MIIVVLSFGCCSTVTYPVECLKNIITCADPTYKKKNVSDSIVKKDSDISFPNGLNIGNNWRLIVDKYDKDCLILQFFDKSGIWLTKTTFFQNNYIILYIYIMSYKY